MKIGLYARVLNSKEAVEFYHHLVSLLKKRKIEVLLHDSFARYLRDNLKIEEVPDSFNYSDLITQPVDYLISIGGDGTMLDTLAIVRDTLIPVLGINLGRFGFLASTRTEDIDTTLDELMNNSHTLESRSVLKLESDSEMFTDFPYALNDFVIQKTASSSMITVHSYLNGEFMNSYWADGLIISTPTGSSGYSLSCGGPLLFPGSSSFVITPIAPHNLTVRPVVIADDNVISFEFEGRKKKVRISLDARYESIEQGRQIAIKRADFKFRLVKLSNENYMNTIRNKLNWGADQRNY